MSFAKALRSSADCAELRAVADELGATGWTAR